MTVNYQRRVVEEKESLDEKIELLSNFFETYKFEGIDPEEQFRLVRQHFLMEMYSNVLGERIVAFDTFVD